ncbi:hypothetical protein QTP70_002841 [Hemibagrus guttatus]|uniref:Reverse transcriptase domain-containing protein n=1 Tax=Hemibagrus guttatus TaxID=175788 RepID=A0AAE0QS47_9TELE|nr:hypothetical protein QTP70_002841 [Hemibagrus guttatus]
MESVGKEVKKRVQADLEKAYDRVPREELWYCMRKSGVAEKYVRVVQDMYERSRTVVRCAVGQTEEFKVEVGLHQGSALSPFLFAIVMDQLSEEHSTKPLRCAISNDSSALSLKPSLMMQIYNHSPVCQTKPLSLIAYRRGSRRAKP